VEVCVADTGVGIPPEVRDRIFDPFFTTKEGGTGLGLATVHRIVEANRGSLRMESAVGVGTTFRILLPRAGEES
jgi:signal transduction histidine kinase